MEFRSITRLWLLVINIRKIILNILYLHFFYLDLRFFFFFGFEIFDIYFYSFIFLKLIRRFVFWLKVLFIWCVKYLKTTMKWLPNGSEDWQNNRLQAIHQQAVGTQETEQGWVPVLGEIFYFVKLFERLQILCCVSWHSYGLNKMFSLWQI